jgi:hypothetical protein
MLCAPVSNNKRMEQIRCNRCNCMYIIRVIRMYTRSMHHTGYEIKTRNPSMDWCDKNGMPFCCWLGGGFCSQRDDAESQSRRNVPTMASDNLT